MDPSDIYNGRVHGRYLCINELIYEQEDSDQCAWSIQDHIKLCLWHVTIADSDRPVHCTLVAKVMYGFLQF